MGTDDWLAILYLLKHPGIQVSAITVTGAGLAHAGPGARMARDLAAVAGQPRIPVGLGHETPLGAGHEFPAEWRAGVDSLQGLRLPANPAPLSPLSAPALIAATAQAAPAPLTVLALGPLTNLAEALATEPALKERIDVVYYMGGAVDVEGNIASSNVGIDNRHAEWNIYCDPLAADIVLRSGIPVVLIPLDVTNLAPVTTSFHLRLSARRNTRAAAFASEILTSYARYLDNGGFYFWDPLTAAILTDESLARFVTRRLGVVQTEGPDCGRLISDAAAPALRYADWVDVARFEALFLDVLNREV
jgi:inosine-uridine nucleoside N-ribohydrolase